MYILVCETQETELKADKYDQHSTKPVNSLHDL
jgi:hypothetical protein